MDVRVTLLEVHKLMYFLQVAPAGRRFNTTFTKGRYGPYAENLSHLMKRMEGHYIVGVGDGDEAPGKEINRQTLLHSRKSFWRSTRPPITEWTM